MIPYALLLVLLVAPATTVADQPPTIDWAECKTEAHCVVLKKCVINGGAVDEIRPYDVERDTTMQDCATGLQTRPFTNDQWLVRLQVAAPTLNPAKGIHFFAGTEKLFGCSLSGTTVKAQGGRNAALYGTDSSLTPTGGYCVFLIKDAASLPSLRAEYKILYTQAEQEAVIKTAGPKKIFTDVDNFIFCNPFSLSVDLSKPLKGYRKARIPDLIKEPISCDGIPHAKLFVGSDEAVNFECKKEKKKYFHGTDIELAEGEQVFCAIPIGTTCSALASELPDTPHFGTDPATGQASLKCDATSSKLLVNGEFYTDIAPTCLNNLDSPNDGAWYATRKEGDAPVAIRTAQCSDKMSCTIISSFNGTSPAGPLYGKAYLSGDGGNISCLNDTALRVDQPVNKIVSKPQSIMCDYARGVYRMNLNLDVYQEDNVYCEATEAPTESAPATGNAGMIVGLAGLAGLLVLAAAIGATLWFLRRRYLKNKKKPKRKPPKNHSSLALPSSESKDEKKKRKKKKKEKVGPNYPACTLEHRIMVMKCYLHPVDLDGQYKYLHMQVYMQFLNVLFEEELDHNVWLEVIPDLIFVERDFFHADQTKNHNIVEREKILPGFCYERFRLYLIDKAEQWLRKYKEERDEKLEYEKFYKDKHGKKIVTEAKHKVKPDELIGMGFIRGIMFILLYKLNIMNKEAKTKIVDRVTDIFLEKEMNLEDPSRFAIWGILHHEETGSKRTPGVHERFGTGNGQRIMFNYLFDEFKKLHKEPLEPRPSHGSKMQHVLFAMGCALERSAMAEVWKIMKEDQRFIAKDFMWTMYGRDWLWDGAWVSMFQNPPEHHLFCDRFTQECKVYKELADMCTRYLPDKYSEDAKKGYCFEGFMRAYDPNIDDVMLQQAHKWFECWEDDRHGHGQDMNRWLLKCDPREIAGYTPVDGETLVQSAVEGWEKKTDRHSIERQLQLNGPLATLDPKAEEPTQPLETSDGAAAASQPPSKPRASSTGAAPAAASSEQPSKPREPAPAAAAATTGPSSQRPSKTGATKGAGQK